MAFTPFAKPAIGSRIDVGPTPALGKLVPEWWNKPKQVAAPQTQSTGFFNPHAYREQYLPEKQDEYLSQMEQYAKAAAPMAAEFADRYGSQMAPEEYFSSRGLARPQKEKPLSYGQWLSQSAPRVSGTGQMGLWPAKMADEMLRREQEAEEMRKRTQQMLAARRGMAQ